MLASLIRIACTGVRVSVPVQLLLHERFRRQPGTVAATVTAGITEDDPERFLTIHVFPLSKVDR
jgi:hypothetical protein